MMSPIEIQNKQGDYNLTTKILKKKIINFATCCHVLVNSRFHVYDLE